MCGIAGFHIKNPEYVKKHEGVEAFANELLCGIEQRGKQATGFVAVTDTGLTVLDKQPLNATEFIKERKPLPTGVRTALFHTRFATKGDNENHLNLHPVVHESCFLTHNGVLSNDDELFIEHELQRKGEVDTEILPAMLNKFGWDKAEEALSKVIGSFAIAAIDPIKEPGRLILAKGSGSPLSIYETPNVLVWASLGYVIRDAWGKVVGTPPKYDKVESFKEGQLMFYDGKRDLREFEVAERPFVRTTTQGSTTGTRQTGWHGTGTTDSHTTPSNSTRRGVVKYRRNEIKARRDAGYGVAITWDQNLPHKILLEKTQGKIIWTTCPSCRFMVLDTDFRYLKDEGLVCFDCYDFEHKDAKLVITDDTKRSVEEWVNKEVVAHRLAIDAVAKAVDIDRDAVEYLIFRVSPTYQQKNEEIKQVSEKLDELYQGELNQAFNDLLDESKDDEVEQAHCELDSQAEEAINADRLRCDQCKKFRKPGKVCTWCHNRRGSEDAVRDGSTEAVDRRESPHIIGTLLSCTNCAAAPEIQVGRFASYCLKCYNFCNEKDCPYGPHVDGKRTDGPGIANHLLPSGKRVCHFHARAVKGAWSDTAIEKAGIVVKELPPVKEPSGL